MSLRIASKMTSGIVSPGLAIFRNWLTGEVRPERLEFLVKGSVLVVLALSLPLIYARAIYGTLDLFALDQRHFLHVLENAYVTWLCGFLAMSSMGRVTTRLHSAVLATVICHGTLILLIFLLRTYYSRPLVVFAIMTTMVLSTGLVLLSQRLRPRRVGIVKEGITDELHLWAGGKAARLITTPTESVRQYDVILVNFSANLGREWTKFAARAMLTGCEVRHAVEYVEERRGRVSPDHFEAEHAANKELHRYIEHYKRPFDIILAVPALVISVPILIVASAAVYLTMGGPVLFKQDRMGRGGRVFKIYKLRTMKPQIRGQVHSATSVNDPRITPLGRFLRRWRIDELPQVYNVLKGDMSFVGPRPEQPALALDYSKAMPAFDFRLMMRPGITGWAQVQSGYAADLKETREKLSFDLYYIKYASLILDIQILLRTFFVLAGLKEVR